VVCSEMSNKYKI